VRRAVTRIWEAILDNIGAAITVALVGAVSALYTPLRSRLANWAIAVWTWLLSLQVVALTGFVWLVTSVALVLVVYWTVRGFVTQRRAAQPKTAEYEADDQSMPEWVRAVGAKLDDLILDLRPCFALGEPTSIQQVFYDLTLPTRGQSWDRVHDVLNVLGAWFRAWDRLHQTVGASQPPKVLIEQIRSLYDLLMYAGLILPEARKPIATIAQDSPAYIIYKATADRYNTFLTNFEGLLRRLPTELGILDDPIVGKEHFFIRL
jgi:lysylphosphatidylglycerol synthetase-like protein (DUF2156 family)